MRIRRTVLFLFLALFFTAAPETASAAQDVPFFIHDPEGLVDTQETQTLMETYTRRAKALNCGIYVAFFETYPTSTYDSAYEFAQHVYTQSDLGLGEGRDGILLVICTRSRDAAICVYGDWANTAFTDYGRDEVLFPALLKELKDDRWQEGVVAFLETCGDLLVRAKEGRPVDVSLVRIVLRAFLIALLPGMGVGYLICLGMKSEMKTARTAEQAAAYVTGLTDLKVKEDHYLRTHVQHIPRPRNTGSSGGGGRRGGGSLGGGTRVNSRGFSGGSRKF